MCFVVYYQTTFMCKTFVTMSMAALIWFLASVFSGVMSDYFYGYNICHNGFTDMVSPQCVFSGVLLYNISCQNICHNGCFDMISPLCVFSGVITADCYWQNIVTCHNYHIDKIYSSVSPQMPIQVNFPKQLSQFTNLTMSLTPYSILECTLSCSVPIPD